MSSTEDSGQAITEGVSVGTRVLARLIDFVLLWVVTLVVIVPVVIGAMFTGAGMGGGFGFGGGIGGLVAAVVSTAIYLGYFVLLESNGGQTLGKRLMKIRTVGPGGGNPTLEQALRRNAWLALGIIPMLGGLLSLAAAIWIIVTIANEQQVAVHDSFAGGTGVVRA